MGGSGREILKKEIRPLQYLCLYRYFLSHSVITLLNSFAEAAYPLFRLSAIAITASDKSRFGAKMLCFRFSIVMFCLGSNL